MNISSVLQQKKHWFSFVYFKKKGIESDTVLLERQINQAKKDWLHAQQNLNFVEDDALIDHFIYLMECTEKRYMFLLGRARILEERRRIK